MLPSEWKTLRRSLDSLQGALSLIRESLDKKTNGTADQQASAREAEKEKTGVLRSIAHGIESSNNGATAAHQQDQRQQGELISAQWWTVRWTAGACIAASIYAAIAGYQAYLTRKIISDSATSTKQTLEKMQKQIDATNQYSVVAAGAYLIAYGAHVDTGSKFVFVNVSNIGHLAADGQMTFFEMAVDRGEPNNFTVGFPIGKVLRGYWTTSTFIAASYMSPPLIRYPLPNFSQDDYVQGKIAVIVSGEVTYRDGFPDTPVHTVPYCWISFENLQTHQQDGMPCDAQRMTARIKQAIRFPAHKISQP